VHCACELCLCIVFVYCGCVVCLCSVLVHCACVLCLCIVLVYCACVMCLCIVLVYCACDLLRTWGMRTDTEKWQTITSSRDMLMSKITEALTKHFYDLFLYPGDRRGMKLAYNCGRCPACSGESAHKAGKRNGHLKASKGIKACPFLGRKSPRLMAGYIMESRIGYSQSESQLGSSG